jgi:hypothetical protein
MTMLDLDWTVGGPATVTVLTMSCDNILQKRLEGLAREKKGETGEVVQLTLRISRMIDEA